MHVNGEQINIYELDTQQSIINRIAAKFNTLPKYIIFQDEKISIDSDIELLKDANIKILDLFSLIKKDAKDSINFLKFQTYLVDTFSRDIDFRYGEEEEENTRRKRKKLKIVQDILYIWLAYNEQLEQIAIHGLGLMMEEINPLIEKGYFENESDFERFWNQKRNFIKKDLELRIEFEKSESDKSEKLYDILKNKEGLVYTDLISDRVNIDIYIDAKEISILELFNYIVLKEEYPFASCKNYYKILKDYIPPEEWAPSNDSIIIKICSKLVADRIKIKDYSDLEISINEEKQIIASARLITERGYLSQKEYIDRFISVFQGIKLNITKIDETEVVGNFYFPTERINMYVFSDLVMNNKLFSNLLFIDESNKATKKKTETSQPWIHVHFNSGFSRITAGITQKVVDRGDPEMRDTDPDIFVHGDPYIRIRVKGRDIKSIQLFQNIFSKLLVIYQDEYESIVKIYEQYIPNFGEIIEIELPIRKEKPEMMAPEIFVKNYSRNCAQAKIPKVVSKDEAEAIGRYMLFPRPVQLEEPHYPSDGRPQKYFICPNPDYPYPGLQKNKLANADIYPFVPCCFKNEQTTRDKGFYKHYYENTPLEITEKKQQELIITDKFLSVDKYGVLSDELTKLFETIDTDTDYRYIRVGVDRKDSNKSSFLHAVMLGLYEQTGISNMNSEERDLKLSEIRIELSEDNIFPLAKQCTFDMTSKEIKDEISDFNKYLDPKKYVQLLEGYFNCNIYLFNRERLFSPQYIQGYYRTKRTGPSIFIYEHLGSESDHAKYPQCELIIRWNTNDSSDTEYYFNDNQNITKTIKYISDSIQQIYVLNKKITEIVFPISDDTQMISQIIDTYGKTRGINFKWKNNNIYMITDPMSPLALPIEDNVCKLTNLDANQVIEFIQHIKGKITSQTVIGNKALEINGELGNVYFHIPILPTEKLLNIEIYSEGLHYAKCEKESKLHIFNKNRKYSRYLTEYIFWLFSKFLNKKKIEFIDDDVILRFVKAIIVIDSNFKYGKVSKTFSTKSGLMKDSKLIVTSEELLKRLLYVLKLYSIRDLKSLLSYHERTVITHYYEDITDFDQYSTQVVLYGEDAIDKWIQENKISYVINEEIIIGQKTPYFFKNINVENRVFLAQNASSLKHALQISAEWNKSGYNVGEDSIDIEIDINNFILYSYINQHSITKHIIGDNLASSAPKILGYKLTGEAYYTVLLDI